MNASPFKRFTRLLVIDGSRRGVVRTALTGMAASTLAGIGLAPGVANEAAAKQKKKRCKPGPLGATCERNKDCCCETGRICSTSCTGGVPGTVQTVCCGTKGSPCTESANCCWGFICNTLTGKCQEGDC